ncbi:MAG: SPFH domain-containing protein [Chloroflexota bacterium]
MENVPTNAIRRIITAIIGIIVIFIAISFLGRFFYFLQPVEEQEVGLQFRNNQIRAVVGPGVYNDFGLFVRLETISSKAIFFRVEDPEIITQDKQRIGLIVTGDVFRPQIGNSDIIRANWSSYQDVYTSDSAAVQRIENFTRQAMKVCVGERTFDDNIIGTARDDLRICIIDSVQSQADEIGLRIENLVVPEVILSPEVQAALDEIVQSRLQTEKAAQDQLRAEAEALAEQARQEGEIRVEQSRLQEQTRQQILLAQLEQERLDAQLVVIEAERANDLARLETENARIAAEKANELLAAERDIEINATLAEAAIAKAEADAAFQKVLAEIYAGNPEYVQLLLVQANADALNPADKIIFTPEGTVPTLVLPGPGIVPTVETTNTAVTVEPEPEIVTESGDSDDSESSP